MFQDSDTISEKMENSDSVEFSVSNSRRKKLTDDERVTRNRERNKIHARKTRVRKKTQSVALQTRINELREEGIRLRQLIDEHYTASSLLGLRDDIAAQSGLNLMPSTSVCRNYYAEMVSDGRFGKDISDALFGASSPTSSKRVRRSGKYTPQERERIRRERNRMHAKKTRDKKKQIFGMSEKIILELEAEAQQLRAYLFANNLITKEECDVYIEKERQAKEEIARLKDGEEIDDTSANSVDEIEIEDGDGDVEGVMDEEEEEEEEELSDAPGYIKVKNEEFDGDESTTANCDETTSMDQSEELTAVSFTSSSRLALSPSSRISKSQLFSSSSSVTENFSSSSSIKQGDPTENISSGSVRDSIWSDKFLASNGVSAVWDDDDTSS